MSRKSNAVAGFTLLEIMISLSIISIALVTLLSANGRALSLSGEAAQLTDAVTLAREQMERIHAGFAADPEENDLHTSEEYPGIGWRIEFLETELPNATRVVMTMVAIDEGSGEEGERILFTLTSYLIESSGGARAPKVAPPANGITPPS
jgi:prepilin-type N-terminal cleavage/methylation domain-containing protein